MPKRQPLEERFWKHVMKAGKDDCWTWTGARRNGKYGEIGADFIAGAKPIAPLVAHRVSWEIHNGPIPTGMSVLHTCDNMICVNPRHLFLGTHDDNMKDRANKGRGFYQTHPDRAAAIIRRAQLIAAENHKGKPIPALVEYRKAHPDMNKGENQPRHKLTSQDVLAIRAAYANGQSARSLADDYGVDRTNVVRIVNRKRWTHI